LKFHVPLAGATLVRRYKRFLADVQLPDGSSITLHCPNTGSMLGCAVPGSRVWYSQSANPGRKYPGTWEIVEVEQGHLAGINTSLANRLAEEALRAGVIAPLRGYANIQREVSYGEENSRIDFLLTGHAQRTDEKCYVEVKNVTLGLGNGDGAFPDAVTTRGIRHLRELQTMRERGHRAVLLFCVQHSGIERVRPAVAIDPAYAAMLQNVRVAGVELMAWRARLSPLEIVLDTQLPVILPGD
jgi:sugar fermentation stimulation protein A